MPFDDRQHTGSHGRQYRIVRPVGLCHEVMQRLMRRPHAPWLHASRHRFDTLTIAGQQQAGAIGLERRRAIGMPQHRRQCLDIGSKA